MSDLHHIDPSLDLRMQRVVDVKPELIWKAWTRPDLLIKWFTPAPWRTVDCKIDLKPGGIFHTTMESPEGQRFPNAGCYLEIVEQQRLIWTSALQPGYRPIPKPENGAGMLFTAAIILEPHPKGTTYTAIAMHSSVADCQRHAAMGFEDGWGKALGQLVEVVKKL